MTPAAFYEASARRGVNYGPAFQGVVALTRQEYEAFAAIELPVAAGADDTYACHPALLDAALQALGAVMPELRQDELALPLRLDFCVCHQTPLQPVWSYVRRRSASWDTAETQAETLFDLDLLDRDGKPAMSLQGLSVMRTSTAALRQSLQRGTGAEPLTYALQWQPLAEADANSSRTGTWLVFADRVDCVRPWMEALDRVCYVLPGPEFAWVDENVCHIDPSKPDHFTRLLQDRGVSSGVIFAWSGRTDVTGAGSPASAAIALCESALYLSQALAARGGDTRLWLVTCGAHQHASPDPAAAALWGLGRVMAREYPEWRVKLVDLDDEQQTPACEWVLDDAENELLWRAGRRHGARLRALQVRPAALRMSSEATYLITGGQGALGRLIAQRLVACGARKLCLVDCREPGEEARTAVEELSAAGVAVAVELGDVANAVWLRDLFARLRTDGTDLRGVVHAAGMVDDGLLINQDGRRMQAVMAPKVFGAWIMHVLTCEMDLDFMLYFSSVAAVWVRWGRGLTGPGP